MSSFASEFGNLPIRPYSRASAGLGHRRSGLRQIYAPRKPGTVATYLPNESFQPGTGFWPGVAIGLPTSEARGFAECLGLNAGCHLRPKRKFVFDEKTIQNCFEGRF